MIIFRSLQTSTNLFKLLQTSSNLFMIIFHLNCRFPHNRINCPLPTAKGEKTSRVQGGLRSQGAMVSMYLSDVHMAIAYMRRVDGTLPPSKSGLKALNFFPEEGQLMCVSTWLDFIIRGFNLISWPQVLSSGRWSEQNSALRILVLLHALQWLGEEKTWILVRRFALYSGTSR